MLRRLNRRPQDREAALQRVVCLVRELFPPPSKRQIPEAQIWPRLSRILPHLNSAVNAYKRAYPPMPGDKVFAELISDVAGMDLYDHGLVTEAYELNGVVVKMLDTLGSPPETAALRTDALTVLGLCTDNMALSKREEGLQIRQDCLRFRKLCFQAIPPGELTQDDKIRLYNSYTDLVCSQQQINDFEGVRQNLLECLEQYKLWGPEDDQTLAYEYSKYYNQMAYVLLWENKGSDAVAYAKKAYELVERAASGTAMARVFQADYAHILFQQGNSKDQALQLLDGLLELSEKDCGKNNLRTMDLRLNVAVMRFLMGDFALAE